MYRERDIYMLIYLSIHMYICIYTHNIHTCMYMCVYVSICVYAYMYICVYVYVYVFLSNVILHTPGGGRISWNNTDATATPKRYDLTNVSVR